MFNLRFSRADKSRIKISNNEHPIHSFLPYQCHWNSNTILTKKKEFISVVKVDGFSFETADDEDLDIKKDSRNNLFKGFAAGNFALWFHTVRRKYSAYPEGEFNNRFSNMLNDQWRARHNPEFTFINEHYVSILRKQNTSGVAFFENLIKKAQHVASSENEDKDLMEAYSEMEEVRERIINAFNSYRPKLLGVKERNGEYYCEIMEFLGAIINTGESQPYLLSNSNIASQLPTHRLYFGPKTIEARGPFSAKYAGLVSIKEYRPSSHAGMLDGFLQLPFELIISQSFVFADRMAAIAKMQLQQRRLVQAQDVAISQIQEIDEALDSAMGGTFGFGDHHTTVMCMESDIKSLESAISQVVVSFSNVGVNAVRERTNLEAAFWSQLPGNLDYVVRKSTINTLNLASYASFHNYPSGKASGNHWGDAVTVFNTTSGTPFFFSFHVRDVGHTMIIGPTGAGKTALMNFLCAQAQKFNPRMFFFDKDRGAEIFIRAIGGRFSIINPARNCGFNPLHLDDTNENRSFLIDWMKTLVSCNGETVTAEEMAKITDAVNGNFKLPKHERRMRNVAAFLGLSTPGSLAGRFAMWHSEGSRANIFDNDQDTIEFLNSRVFGFEMGELLKDKTSLAPVLIYLFHRISMALDGTPTMVVLDEAWALIDNPVFGPKIKDWLKVMRKLNAMVIFATQSVEDAAKSSISDTLVQQTATQIFLPNLKATEVYRSVFMLSAREYTLIKTTDPSSRYFLVKQDNSGVIARIDLGGMTDVINVISGRADTVILLDEIRQELGDDPNMWLPVFLTRVRGK